VISRAVQGLGGALLFPTTLALISTYFAEGGARNRASWERPEQAEAL
jgi:MFS family permease